LENPCLSLSPELSRVPRLLKNKKHFFLLLTTTRLNVVVTRPDLLWLRWLTVMVLLRLAARWRCDGLSVGLVPAYRVIYHSTKYVHIQSTTVYNVHVCPPGGLSPPPSNPRVGPPPRNQGGGGHTRLRARGGGVPIPTTEKA